MLSINLSGRKAFIAGVSDDHGYGWAIAKALAEAGAKIYVGTWTPTLGIFTKSLNSGRLDASRRLSDGSLMEIETIYPLDASYDTPQDVPESIKTNKRYSQQKGYTISEVASQVKKDLGCIDVLVHSLANGPEVKLPLLDTSREGYLAAISSSAYSFVSLLRHFSPIMSEGAAALCLTYLASERTIPGYGGGMSSAKAALESDTRTLAWELGQRYKIRVNAISAGPLASRAAKAIGFIEKMVTYCQKNAPLSRDLKAEEIALSAAFLLSPLARAITGETLHVDNGFHSMGVAVDSPSLEG